MGKKVWIGIGLFVALVAAASFGIWKSVITAHDHPVTPAVKVTSTPPAAPENPAAPSPENPTAAKSPARASGGAKKSVAAAPSDCSSEKTSTSDVSRPPSTAVSGTGDLKLFSNPDGAAIEIDGHGDPSMKTPFFANRLAHGPHQITFIKTGYLDEKRSVDVAAGKTAFVGATLTRAAVATSDVTFNSDPGGAGEVGRRKKYWQSRPAQSVIVAGAHQFVFRKPGFEDATIAVTLIAGQSFATSNVLKPLAPVASNSPFGKLKKVFGGNNGATAEENVNVTIKSTPAGAAISLNGKDLGQQTPFTLPLAPGKYDIALALAGHQTVRKSIKVEKDKPLDIQESLPGQ